METIRTRGYRISVALLCAIAFAWAAFTALPSLAFAEATANDIAVDDLIVLGDDAVEGYNGIPQWRVLSKADDGSMLLMSEYLWTGDGSDATVQIKHDPSNTSNAWQGSNSQAWCKAFETAVLSDVDKLTIKPTTKSDDEYYVATSTYGGYTYAAAENILNNDTVFFLSAEELDRFMPNQADRVAYDADGATGLWYLRSPDKDSANRVGSMLKNGQWNRVTAWSGLCARPAFWASFDSDAAFTQTTEGDKTIWSLVDTGDPAPRVTEDIAVIDRVSCTNYEVLELAWKLKDYQTKNIPPIYVVHAAPNSSIRIMEPGLVTEENHTYVAAGGGYAGLEFPMDSAHDIISCTSGGGSSVWLTVGDPEDYENPNLSYLIEDWAASWGPLADKQLPTAEDLLEKIKVAALDPNHPEETEASILWVKGAGTQDRVNRGVSDYLLVAILDNNATGTVQHTWGEPTWSWTGNDIDGYTEAKASFTCELTSVHKTSVDAVVTSEVKDGNVVYTATATLDGKEYTDTKTVESQFDIVSVEIAPDSSEMQPSAGAYIAWLVTFKDGVNIDKFAANGGLNCDEFQIRRKPVGEDWKDSTCPVPMFTKVSENTGILAIMPDTLPDNEVTERMPWSFTYKGEGQELVPIIYQSPVDKSALEEAIKAAISNKKDTPVSTDGKDLANGTKYVNQDAADELQAAIAQAQETFDKEKATQAVVDAATKKIKEANQAFDDAKKVAKNEVAPQPVTTKTAIKSATAPAQKYTGKALKPAVTVKDAKGKVVPASAYTVTYANNKYPGTATATVKAKANSKYTGTVKATFKITAAEQGVYWLVNKKTGENLYTTAVKEVNTLSKVKKTWTNKGLMWYAPTVGDPIYRLVNKKTGDHHFTKSTNEVRVLTKVKKTWTADFNGKPIFYSGGPKKIWRQYSDARQKAGKPGTHKFTTYNAKLKGWKNEGALIEALRYGKVNGVK